jgi:SAM-dependent methyltransferase
MAIADSFTSVARYFPRLRKLMWKQLYQMLARFYPNADWTFMNYGYASLEPGNPVPELSKDDEPDRSFIQLYHSILHGRSLAGGDVLEVGCGRGGGCSYIARYLKPRSVCGVDLSSKAVRFCRRKHRVPTLKFKVGDSERLPFKDESFDAVVNVESSHCYPSIDRFFSEVRRILRPGGTFHIADLWDDVRVEWFHSLLKNSGMEIEEGGDITPNVITAMRRDSARRIELFRKTLFAPLVMFFQEFAGNEESRIFRKFEDRRVFYYGYLLRKA